MQNPNNIVGHATWYMPCFTQTKISSVSTGDRDVMRERPETTGKRFKSRENMNFCPLVLGTPYKARTIYQLVFLSINFLTKISHRR